MKLRIEQLAGHLQTKLLPIYCICGAEYLLVEQGRQQINQQALTKGFTERQTFTITQAADWQALEHSIYNNSLFANKRLLEVHLPAGKTTTLGSKLLIKYAASPPPDICLLLITDKIETKNLRAAWIKAIDKAGVFIQVWPLAGKEFQKWLQQQCSQAKLEFTTDAFALFTDCLDNDLLTAKQELTKLQINMDAGQVIDLNTLQTTMVENTNCSLFALADAVLAGQSGAISKMLYQLKAQALEPILILWSISRQCEELATMAYDLAQGQSLSSIMANKRYSWSKNSLMTKALKQYSLAHWQQCLQNCKQVDKIIKGDLPGAIWSELLSLCLAMAGGCRDMVAPAAHPRY